MMHIKQLLVVFLGLATACLDTHNRTEVTREPAMSVGADTSTVTSTGDVIELRQIDETGTLKERFGESVAISGNIGLVGAPRDNQNGPETGAVYLFDVNTGVQIYKLTPNVPTLGFGNSVAISGNIALIGARADDENGYNSGAAYVFDLGDVENIDVERITQIHKLTPQAPSDADSFGIAVAISDNIALIGATAAYAPPGKAYLFNVSTGEQIAKLTPDHPATRLFGTSVAIRGNIALVGAWGDDQDGAQSGAAYLFDLGDVENLDVNDISQIRLRPDNPMPYEIFGSSVAIHEEFAIVGAGRTFSAVYLFDVTGGNLIRKLELPHSQLVPSIDVSGNTMIVGVMDAAYLLDVTTGGEIAKLVSEEEPSVFFGRSVALSGNIAVVGAPADRGRGPNDGAAAYLFHQSLELNCMMDGTEAFRPHQFAFAGVDYQYKSPLYDKFPSKGELAVEPTYTLEGPVGMLLDEQGVVTWSPSDSDAGRDHTVILRTDCGRHQVETRYTISVVTRRLVKRGWVTSDGNRTVWVAGSGTQLDGMVVHTPDGADGTVDIYLLSGNLPAVPAESIAVGAAFMIQGDAMDGVEGALTVEIPNVDALAGVNSDRSTEALLINTYSTSGLYMASLPRARERVSPVPSNVPVGTDIIRTEVPAYVAVLLSQAKIEPVTWPNGPFFLKYLMQPRDDRDTALRNLKALSNELQSARGILESWECEPLSTVEGSQFVFVLDIVPEEHGLEPDASVSGIVDPDTSAMLIHREFLCADLESPCPEDTESRRLLTAAHELIHWYQGNIIPERRSRQQWWAEATAEYGSSEIVKNLHPEWASSYADVLAPNWGRYITEWPMRKQSYTNVAFYKSLNAQLDWPNGINVCHLFQRIANAPSGLVGHTDYFGDIEGLTQKYARFAANWNIFRFPGFQNDLPFFKLTEIFADEETWSEEGIKVADRKVRLWSEAGISYRINVDTLGEDETPEQFELTVVADADADGNPTTDYLVLGHRSDGTVLAEFSDRSTTQLLTFEKGDFFYLTVVQGLAKQLELSGFFGDIPADPLLVTTSFKNKCNMQSSCTDCAAEDGCSWSYCEGEMACLRTTSGLPLCEPTLSVTLHDPL